MKRCNAIVILAILTLSIIGVYILNNRVKSAEVTTNSNSSNNLISENTYTKNTLGLGVSFNTNECTIKTNSTYTFDMGNTSNLMTNTYKFDTNDVNAYSFNVVDLSDSIKVFDTKEGFKFPCDVYLDSELLAKSKCAVIAEDDILTIVTNDSVMQIDLTVIDAPTEDILPRESEITYVEMDDNFNLMPTVANYTGDDEEIRKKIEGTDKWNDLIYEVATREGVDPVYVKCIIAKESCGDPKETCNNKNGTVDYGLMMVNSSWGDIYDYNRILNDPEYAIECGIKVLKEKERIAKSLGLDTTIYNVSWLYNGYTKQGKKYANNMKEIYEGLSGNDATVTYFEYDD